MIDLVFIVNLQKIYYLCLDLIIILIQYFNLSIRKSIMVNMQQIKDLDTKYIIPWKKIGDMGKRQMVQYRLLGTFMIFNFLYFFFLLFIFYFCIFVSFFYFYPHLFSFPIMIRKFFVFYVLFVDLFIYFLIYFHIYSLLFIHLFINYHRNLLFYEIVG